MEPGSETGGSQEPNWCVKGDEVEGSWQQCPDLGEGGASLPGSVDLGRSAGLPLPPVEFSSDTTFSKKNSFWDPSQSWRGFSLCLAQRLGTRALTFAEFYWALSSWRAGKSPQYPAQGVVGAAAQKMLLNPDSPDIQGAERRNLPLYPSRGRGGLGRGPLVTHISCPPCDPAKGGQLQGLRRNPLCPGPG